MIALGKDKADVEVRSVLRGQRASFEVEGGFARKEAPCDGLLIETRTSTILVPMADVEKALAELKRARVKGQEVDSP